MTWVYPVQLVWPVYQAPPAGMNWPMAAGVAVVMFRVLHCW